MEIFSYIVLVPMVYAATAVFILGIIIRLVAIYRTPENPTTLQIYPEKKFPWMLALYDTFCLPTVRRQKPLLWIFLIVFHTGMLLLIIGHFELFKMVRLFQIIPHDVFIGGGWTGAVILLCVAYFLFRRFYGPVRELSVPEDYFLLILLFLTVLFGAQLNWARTFYWYQEFGVAEYRNYLLSLVSFKPQVPYELMTGGHSLMVVLHVFFANLFLMVFPFSKLMHAIFSLPMNKLRRG